MERKERRIKAECVKILWTFMAVFLCAVPCIAIYVPGSEGDTLNVGTGFKYEQILNDGVVVDNYGTLNMCPGAYVDWDITANFGSTVNIWDGTLGPLRSVIVNYLATVTVYGPAFEDSSGPITTTEWNPGGEDTLTVTDVNGVPIFSLQFYSFVKIYLDSTGTPPPPPPTPENTPPVADAGSDLTVYTMDVTSTVIDGTATDEDASDSLVYRWLEGSVELTPWAPVGENGEAPLDLGPILLQDPLVGTHTLTLEVSDGTDTVSDEMVLEIEIYNIYIDIKPGSYPNAINLGSNGVIPVAILSTEDFTATTIDPDTVSLAGSGVAVRGKGNKSLATQEDVNGDGLMDLVVKVETENLDPGTFQNGLAILQVIVEGTIIYEGSDEIIIVPPE